MKENLGKMGRDKVTGCEGVIMAHAIHLFGCDTYMLRPKVDKDGKLPDGGWFDAGRIEIGDVIVKPEEVQTGKKGGEDLPVLN